MSRFAIPPWILALVVVLMGLNLNGYLLFDHDEGAFSEATRGMFERGDFITTWLNDRVRFDKPILIYWLQGLSMSLFGIEVWVFRLPSVLAGIAWTLTIYSFARKHLDQGTANAAALIAALSFGVTAISHLATADA
ncbi:MAG: ArnT family glycosyltransferase, partial [Oceanobacter sp.]